MIASLSRTAIEPAQPICSAVTGSPERLNATVIAPSRWRRSVRSRASARIAMTSEAAVMSKPVSRGEPFVGAAEARDDVAEAAVVHVDAAPPRDRVRVDVELVAVHHVRVEERREQVVGGRDRVHVAGEVEVEILHRHDLRVAGARRAALDAEDRAERGLADAQQRLLADRAHALRERDRRRRLALAGLGRRDRRDADDLAVGLVLQPVEHREADLRLVAAVGLDLVHLRGRRPPRSPGSGGARPPGRSRDCSSRSSYSRPGGRIRCWGGGARAGGYVRRCARGDGRCETSRRWMTGTARRGRPARARCRRRSAARSASSARRSA